MPWQVRRIWVRDVLELEKKISCNQFLIIMLLLNITWNLLLWSCPVFCGVSFKTPSNAFNVTRMTENHFWDWFTNGYWIQFYVASVMDLFVLRKNQLQSSKLSCREIHVEKGSVCPQGYRRLVKWGTEVTSHALGELSLDNRKINDLEWISAPVRSWGDECKLNFQNITFSDPQSQRTPKPILIHRNNEAMYAHCFESLLA